MLNLAKPPRIVHPYPFDRVASNPWQDMRGRARFPQGLLGGQIVGRNERLQIPERLLQDALGAYQLLLMVKDIMLQRGHGSAGLALDRTSGTPSPTARLRAFPNPSSCPNRVGIKSRSSYGRTRAGHVPPFSYFFPRPRFSEIQPHLLAHICIKRIP